MAETLSAKTSQALGITDPIKDLTTKRDTAMQEELVAGEKIQALETKKLEAEAKRTSEQAQEKVKSTEELKGLGVLSIFSCSVSFSSYFERSSLLT